MTLHFSIEYHTEWGQNVEVELTFLSSDGKTHRQHIPLETEDGLLWKGVFMLKARGKQLRYTYIITASSDGGGVGGATVIRREWDVVPRLFPADDARTYFFIDHWRDVPKASYCYTEAFQVAQGLWRSPAASVALFPRTYFFRVQAPQLAAGERVALVGDQPSLGNWDTARALPMVQSGQLEWILSISADGLRLPFEYKYVVVSARPSEGEATALSPLKEQAEESVRWEAGPNRQSPSSGQWSLVNGSWVLAFSDGEMRMKMPQWRAAGLVIPLFSLRTEGSQGVGDFGDLKEIANWAAHTGMHAVQLLPIYDTTQGRTETDSYPYNAISVHALHPIYADLRQLPLSESDMFVGFQERWQKLNNLPALDYVEVLRLKEEYLHQYYEEQRSSICLRTAYRTFAKENAEWLEPYSVFCHLRDAYATSCFEQWPELSAYNRTAVAEYIEQHPVEVEYYSFVQFILHSQLTDAAAYARSIRVFLKGDLPIGISPSSVEAWQEPHLFNRDMSAGAPPDDFSREGQNWGFPTYNWDCMATDGYLWWKRRLSGMAQYFSAYRIDHILGFFRIWQIPKGEPSLAGQFSPALPMSVGEIESYGMRFNPDLFVRDARQQQDGSAAAKKSDGQQNEQGLYHPRISAKTEEAWLHLTKYEQDAFARLYEDFFFHRHNDFWAEQAMKKLPALIGASNMLVCGEDLGMVPACVGPVLQRLNILTLEIQAMPKTYGVAFADLQDNPYSSVDTIFTHDMPTLRLWWKENTERTQLFYNTVLEHEGKAPKEATGQICEEVLADHLDSPSMLCLISLQDWLSIDEKLRNPKPEDERINVPANPKHYWRYRMHLPISELKKAKALNERLQRLIADSGRE